MTEIQLEKMYQAWYQDFKKLGLKKNIKSYSDGREKFSLRKKINGSKGKQSSNFFFSISLFIYFLCLYFCFHFVLSFYISAFYYFFLHFCFFFLSFFPLFYFFLSVALTGPRPVVMNGIFSMFVDIN